METGKRKLQSNPRQSASVLSILFFSWTIPFFKRSYSKVLDPNDISEPLPIDSSTQLGDRLERYVENIVECNAFFSHVESYLPRFFFGIQNMVWWMQEKGKTIASASCCESILVRAIDYGTSLFNEWCCSSVNFAISIGRSPVIFSVNLLQFHVVDFLFVKFLSIFKFQ